MKNELDDLIRRLNKNDKEAFNVLFYMYAEKIFKFGLTFFNDEEESEEVVQEVFLRIWLNRHSITNPVSFDSFIYTIAKNLIFNNLKKNVYRKKYETYAYNHRGPANNETENAVIFEETRKNIEWALEKLPKKRREVFLMSRRDGLKNKEIAEKLDISIKTVETHMALTLKYLKSTFNRD